MTMPIESLQSDAVAHKLLGKVHQGSTANPAALYRIAAKVGACARQAVAFEAAADRTEWSTAPLLEYYAMLHWMKVLLHLTSLDYPPSSAVLQHGMSCRRMKRENYRWPLESVYLYKQGVLQSFWVLAWNKGNPVTRRTVGDEPAANEGVFFRDSPSLATPPVLPAKLVIGTLLGQIPAMREALALFYPQFAEAIGRMDDRSLAPSANPRLRAPSPDTGVPTLPTVAALPDWFLQFVLLFSLSGLVRYNPVEWSDIVVWSNESDSYLVREFFRQPRYQFRLEKFVVV